MCKISLVLLRISVQDGGCQSEFKRKILRLFVVRDVTKVCINIPKLPVKLSICRVQSCCKSCIALMEGGAEEMGL